jgi:hypothetical protein
MSRVSCPMLTAILMLLVPLGMLLSQCVELGPGGTLLMNVPYCGG